MSFATANLNYSPLGTRSKLEGDWTGNQGDATGTVTVSGGRVYEAIFHTQPSTPGGPTANIVPVGVSTSGSQITVQVYNHEEVTAGRFTIVYG